MIGKGGKKFRQIVGKGRKDRKEKRREGQKNGRRNRFKKKPSR